MIWLLACHTAGALPTTGLSLNDAAIVVEVADDPAERSQGLMYRDDMDPEHGMLFVYQDAQPRNFWMKNTRIALSIAYLDASGVIVSLSDMRPLDTSFIPSGAPAMYALEMNKGWFDKHDIRIGTVVKGLPPASAQ